MDKDDAINSLQEKEIIIKRLILAFEENGYTLHYASQSYKLGIKFKITFVKMTCFENREFLISVCISDGGNDLSSGVMVMIYVDTGFIVNAFFAEKSIERIPLDIERNMVYFWIACSNDFLRFRIDSSYFSDLKNDGIAIKGVYLTEFLSTFEKDVLNMNPKDALNYVTNLLPDAKLVRRD